jgi:hypothetical protein
MFWRTDNPAHNSQQHAPPMTVAVPSPSPQPSTSIAAAEESFPTTSGGQLAALDRLLAEHVIDETQAAYLKKIFA